MVFEEALSKAMFAGQGEKTFIDKILAREDVTNIREIIRKDKLTREDLLDILNLLSSTESKLLNYGEWDRYVILKFFVWIREFVKTAEILLDYKERLEEREIKEDLKISVRSKTMLDNNVRLIEHNIKFLVDLYLNIARTTLSIGATGLMEILKTKFEVSYPLASGTQAVEGKTVGGLFRK